jgi:hypothetical protein
MSICFCYGIYRVETVGLCIKDELVIGLISAMRYDKFPTPLSTEISESSVENFFELGEAFLI